MVSVRLPLFLLLAMGAGVASAEPSTAELADQAKKRAEEYSFDFERPQYEDMERVKELAKVGRKRAQKEFERFAAKYQKDAAGKEKKADSDIEQVDGVLLVALSSSMPEETVRDYMAQLQRVPEATVVLRGFVGGATTVKETGAWIERVRRKSPACRDCGHYPVKSIVDPILYRELGIQQVPAVAYIPGVKEISHCDGEDFRAAVVAYGVTPIGYALQEMKRNGSHVPEVLIKRLEGQGWEAKGG